jgi:hypothetical protein
MDLLILYSKYTLLQTLELLIRILDMLVPDPIVGDGLPPKVATSHLISCQRRLRESRSTFSTIALPLMLLIPRSISHFL